MKNEDELENPSQRRIYYLQTLFLLSRVSHQLSSDWCEINNIETSKVKNKGWKITLNQFIKHHVYEHIYKKERLY